MAFNTKLIYCETKDQFQKQLDAEQITDTSIVFIKSTGELWTHGKLFAGNFVSKDSNKIALTLGGSSVELSKAGHTHSYLPLSGGTLTGALNFANNTWNKLGDDAYIGDHNVGNHLCIKAISGTTAGIAFFNSSDGAIGKLASANNTLQWNGTSISLSNHNHDDRYVNITGDTMTGPLIVVGKGTSAFNTPGIIFGDNSGRIGTSGDNSLGIFAGNIVLRPGSLDASSGKGLYVSTTAITYNDNKVWHAGNDGSGSGLNSDLLDDWHRTDFYRTYNGSKTYGCRFATGGTDNSWKKIFSLSVPTTGVYKGCTVKGVIYYAAGNFAQSYDTTIPFEVIFYLGEDSPSGHKATLYLPRYWTRDIIHVVKVSDYLYEIQVRQEKSYHQGYIYYQFWNYSCTATGYNSLQTASSGTTICNLSNITTMVEDTAYTATKLGTTTIGNATTPIYLNSGTPTACSVSISGNANTIAVRDGSGDLQCRLVRPTYANQTTISGALAFRINNSSDNYIRFCSDTAAIRTWLGVSSSSHSHTVFKNNVMIKGTNGMSDSASIHLGIGDSDTGFKWISDGVVQMYSNNVNIGQWNASGMNWTKTPQVNGVAVALSNHNHDSAYLKVGDSATVGNNSKYLSFANDSGGIGGVIGTNDQWRIYGRSTAANAGYLEIATSDDGDEPIYFRQYTGVFTTLKRTLTLLDASGNTSLPGNLSCGWINGGLRVDYGDDLVGLRWRGVHTVEFGGNTGYAHTSYYFRPSYSSSGPTETSLVVQNASASNSPTFTTTHAFWADGVGYHKRALGVGRESPSNGYDAGIYTGTVLANNWFRSEGDTGWYNQTYGGGWYMQDTTWIRAYNNKGVMAIRFDADSGLAGSSWNNGDGAFTVRIHNNSNQTPILLAYRRRPDDTGANRLFALELLNSGSQLAFGMGGKHVATLNNKSELSASLFIGNLSGYASSAGVLHLEGEAGSSTGTSLPSNVGMQLYQYYGSGNGPTMYGNFLRIRGNNGGCGELFLGWQGDNNTSDIWYKSKRDVGSWGAWRQVAFTDSNVASADQAIVAEYLSPHYAGGVQTNPQTYFSNSTGVKVAMTGVGGMGSYWTDTLWINGYSGSDAKGMCALHFSKQNGPRFSISYQNHDNSFYGTCYEVWTSYNFNPSSVVSDNIKWAMYKVTIGSSSVSYSKMSGNHNFISGSSRLGTGSATLSLSYPSGASKTSIMMSATGHHAGSDWHRIVYASLQPDYGSSNQIKLMLGDDSINNDGEAIITFMYVG